MRARVATVAVVPILASAPACTFSDGVPFATVEASIAVSAPIAADRDAGEPGWQRLASDFEVELATVELSAAAIELVDLGFGGVGFDPANPPEGYSLCHNGHCHADDGSLVDFDEIAAELAGAGAVDRVAVSLPLGVVDALAGAELDLACEPGCDLAAPASIGLVRLDLDGLAIAGRVRDSADPPRINGQRDFAIEVGPGAFAWIAPIDLPIDREADPDVRLELALELTSEYLDGVDFAADLTTQQPAVVGGLGELDLDADVYRGGELVIPDDHGDEHDE